MEFDIAFVKSQDQFILKSFSKLNEANTAKLIACDALPENHYQGILVASHLGQQGQLPQGLENETRFAPIRESADFKLGEEEFLQLDYHQGVTLLERIHRPWVLKNNLELLQNLFPTLEHLKELFPSDRSAFFEELWFLLRNHLGARSLTLIYNDLLKSEEEGAKKKLIQVKIEGTRMPNPSTGGAAESQLMEHYRNNFSATFELNSWEEDKGEWIATAFINKSPILIMAKIPHYSNLQGALFKALFDGLQYS